MTTQPTVAVRLAQPTPELHASRVQHVIETFDRHTVRSLDDPKRCGCGVAVGDWQMLQHAAEQVLISLPDKPAIEVPTDAELLDRALSALNPDVPADPESEDYRAHVLAWKTDVTRLHEQVYAPVINEFIDELRTVGLAWETLAEHYAATLEEHAAERVSLRAEGDRLRGELARMLDLIATRMQVERQQATIRGLLTQIRELGGTVDDTTLDALVAAGEGR